MFNNSDTTIDDYTLTIPTDGRRKLAIAWLWLGLFALLASGIFSILLVLSRTPQLSPLFPWIDFFHKALVIHVDLSVLVWFLAFAGLFWSINDNKSHLSAGWTALGLGSLGTLLMTVSPFYGDGAPVMSNYIPVVENTLFFTGLLTFGLGIGTLVLASMVVIPKVGVVIGGPAAIRFGLNTMAVSAVFAIGAFVWSYLSVPQHLEDAVYYELLFWGGGHVLQFTYTLVMLISWLWLASASQIRLPVSPRVVLLLFGFGLFSVFFTPVIYLSYPVTSPHHVKLFTWMMEYGGSLATLPLSFAVLIGLMNCEKSTESTRPLRTALVSSILLFGSGGIIGFLITGSDVTIPAHYHGCIVGITLALMGITYDLLPKLGFQKPAGKLAAWQPIIYGGGQFLHIAGLVWSGGYGVQRKVAGEAQMLDTIQEVVAMGIMGFGGLISVFGGFLFVYLAIRSLLAQRPVSQISHVQPQ